MGGNRALSPLALASGENSLTGGFLRSGGSDPSDQGWIQVQSQVTSKGAVSVSPSQSRTVSSRDS